MRIIINILIILFVTMLISLMANVVFEFETKFYIFVIFGISTLGLLPFMIYRENGLFISHILFNMMTKKERPLGTGFGFKLPWEVISEPEEINESAEIGCTIRDNFPVIGGTVVIEIVIASKANLRDRNGKLDTRKVTEYALFNEKERIKMLESRGRQLAREAVKDKTPEEAQALKQEDFFTIKSFRNIAKKLNVTVIKAQLVDIDLDDATKTENEAKFRTKVLVENKNKLVSEGDFDKKFAEEIAASMDGSIPTTREHKEYNIPGLKEVLEKFLNK